MILQTLEPRDEGIDGQFWKEEAQRRLAAHRSGLVAGVPAEGVLGHL